MNTGDYAAEVLRYFNQGTGLFLDSVKESLELRTRALDCPYEVTSLGVCGDSVYTGLASGEVLVTGFESGNSRGFELLAENTEFKVLEASDSDGLLFGGGTNGLIAVWNLKSLKVQTKLAGHSQEITCLECKGKSLFSASKDSQICVWNTTTMDLEYILAESPIQVECLVVNSNLVFGGYFDGVIRVWSTDKKEVLAYLEGHEQAVKALALVSPKELVSGGADRTILVWNLIEGSIKRRVQGHEGAIEFLELTSDKEFLVSGSSDTVKIWGVRSQTWEALELVSQPYPKVFCYSKENNCILFASNRQVTFKHLDLQSDLLKCIGQFSNSCVFVLEKKAATLSAFYESKYFELEEKATEWLFEDKVKSGAKFSGGIALGLESGSVSLIRNKSQITKQVKPSAVLSVCFCGAYLVAGLKEGSLVVLRLESLEKVKEVPAHKGQVTCLKKLSETAFISGSTDQLVKVWSLENLECVSLKGHTDSVNCVDVLGNFAVSGSSDKTLIVWKVDQNTSTTLKGHLRKVNAVVLQSKKFCFSGGEDFCVCVWSVQDRILLTRIETSYTVSSLALSGDKLTLVIGTRYGLLFELKNPLNVENTVSILPNRHSGVFLNYIKQTLQGRVTTFQSVFKDFVVYPYRINVLHLFARLKKADLLKEAIKSETKFFPNLVKENPLWISVKSKSKQCTEAIVKCVSKYVLKTNPEFYQYVEQLLTQINLTSLQSLENLYETGYFCVEGLPQFGVLKHKQRCILMESETQQVSPERFLSAKRSSAEEEEISFYQSKVRLPLNLGSDLSINFLESLVLSEDSDIFKAQLTEKFLAYKWSKARWIATAEAVVYLYFLSVFLLFSLTQEKDSFTYQRVLFWNVVFTFKETLRMWRAWKFFIGDFGNIVETLQIILLYAHLFSYEYDILPVIILGIFSRAISFLRILKPTRYFIRMLVQVFKDSIAFILILGLSIFVFSVLMFIEGQGSYFSDAVLHSYVTAYGAFDTAGYDSFRTAIFLLASAINTLILLNLLLGIIGDTYDRVSHYLQVADQKALATLLIEAETLMFWRRKDSKVHYLQECRVAETRLNSGFDWKGKVNEINQNLKLVGKKLKSASEDLKTLKTSMKSLPDQTFDKFYTNRLSQTYSLKKRIEFRKSVTQNT